MSARVRLPLILMAALFVTSATVNAQRLSEDNLEPEALFTPKANKTLGYATGFEVAYFRLEAGHHWKLSERSFTVPDSTPTPIPAGDDVVTTELAPEPTPEPELKVELAAGPDEAQFTAQVDLLRPTFVTLVFTESTDAANQMVADFLAEKQELEKLTLVEEEEPKDAENPDDADDEGDDDTKEDKPYVPPIVVFKLKEDKTLSPNAIVYNREFNLGRAGGMRRASAIVASKGKVFMKVDARKGLKDTIYDGEERNLELRARSVADYVLKKL